MKKIRLGNDFILKLILYKVDNLLVLDNDGNPISGTPEDLTNAKNITLKLYNINYRKEYNIVKSINVNIIQSEILSNILQIGKHYILLEYDQDNLEFESGYLHFKIGLYSFEILSQNSNIETVDLVILYSCVSSGNGSGNIDLSEYVKITDLNNTLLLYSKSSDLLLKVDKIDGKLLSDNNYTTIDKNKLDGISDNANLYIHPDKHSPSIINQDINNRFVSDNEKIIWNNKLDSIGFNPENTENKNIANGYAGLDENGKLILSLMPSAIITSVAGKTGDVILTKSDVGLSNVDNTADLSKSVLSASKLTQSRSINGVAFDGSTNITITDETKLPLILVGTVNDYYRGDKTWQTLNKSTIGLNNVENISLSTWAGSSNISTVGNVTNGTWNGDVLSIEKGGTGLSVIGLPNQILKVNALGNGLEYASTSESSSGTVTSVSMTVPTGLIVTGSPVTTAGTFSVTLASGYSIPTTVNQTNWNTAYSWGNHAGLYQPIDADLTAIAALSETSGLLKKTGADTWTLDTTSYATTSALDGKVDKIAGKGLSTEDFTSGLLTKLNGIAAGAEVNVQSNWLATEGDSLILNKPTTLLGYGITDAQAKSNDLTAIDALSGTNGFLKKTAVDTWSLDTNTYLTGNQPITLSGAVTGSGTTTITTTYDAIVPTTKGGTGLSTLGTAGQVLKVNAGATGLEWGTAGGGVEVTSTDVEKWNTASTRASYMLPLVNRSNTMAGTPATAISGITNSTEIIYAELSANATLGYFEHPSPGQNVHLIIKNTSASAITITIPNTGNYTSLSGTSLSISAGGFGEINTLCYATSKYLIRAL